MACFRWHVADTSRSRFHEALYAFTLRLLLPAAIVRKYRSILGYSTAQGLRETGPAGCCRYGGGTVWRLAGVRCPPLAVWQRPDRQHRRGGRPRSYRRRRGASSAPVRHRSPPLLRPTRGAVGRRSGRRARPLRHPAARLRLRRGVLRADCADGGHVRRGGVRSHAALGGVRQHESRRRRGAGRPGGGAATRRHRRRRPRRHHARAAAARACPTLARQLRRPAAPRLGDQRRASPDVRDGSRQPAGGARRHSDARPRHRLTGAGHVGVTGITGAGHVGVIGITGAGHVEGTGITGADHVGVTGITWGGSRRCRRSNWGGPCEGQRLTRACHVGVTGLTVAGRIMVANLTGAGRVGVTA